MEPTLNAYLWCRALTRARRREQKLSGRLQRSGRVSTLPVQISKASENPKLARASNTLLPSRKKKRENLRVRDATIKISPRKPTPTTSAHLAITSDGEQGSNHLLPLAYPLAAQRGGRDREKRGPGLVRDGFPDQSFAWSSHARRDNVGVGDDACGFEAYESGRCRLRPRPANVKIAKLAVSL